MTHLVLSRQKRVIIQSISPHTRLAPSLVCARQHPAIDRPSLLSHCTITPSSLRPSLRYQHIAITVTAPSVHCHGTVMHCHGTLMNRHRRVCHLQVYLDLSIHEGYTLVTSTITLGERRRGRFIHMYSFMWRFHDSSKAPAPVSPLPPPPLPLYFPLLSSALFHSEHEQGQPLRLHGEE